MRYEYRKYKLEIVKESSVVSSYNYQVESPNDIHKYLVNICNLHKCTQEHFLAIAMNAKGKIIGYSITAMGDLCSMLIHPRETFKFLICCNAASVIFAHNHPSENPIPSQQDINSTKQLKEAGDILGIAVLDHIIVANETTFFSMKQEGLI